jgi:hypothetical protein
MPISMRLSDGGNCENNGQKQENEVFHGRIIGMRFRESFIKGLLLRRTLMAWPRWFLDCLRNPATPREDWAPFRFHESIDAFESDPLPRQRRGVKLSRRRVILPIRSR